MSNWKGWILPGILVVGLLTVLSAYFRAQGIESSLTSKTSQMLAGEYPWASVAVDGRDVTVSGVSPSQSAKADALRAAERVYGVRIAMDGADLLQLASPYVLSAVKADGRIVLSGNVLNSGMRALVIAAATKANPGFEIVDELIEARGEPDGFETFAVHGLEQLALMDTGRFEMNDARFSFAGDATSLDAYDALIANVAGDHAGKFELDGLEITPPVVSPYVWNAMFVGDQVTVGGYAPDPSVREAIVGMFDAALPGASIANELRIASGAPANFRSATDFAASLLANLSEGSAELVDTKLTITGVARDDAAFARATALIGEIPEGYEFAANEIRPLPAQNFVWRLSKTGQGITIEGIAANQQAASEIVAMVTEATGETVVDDQQVFASGEPESFQKAREFAADLLSILDIGTALVEGNTITLTGRAEQVETLRLLQRAMNLRVPEGYEGVLDVTVPDTVVIKGKEIKLDNVPQPEEPEQTAEQLCENDMQAAVDGRKIQFESGKAVLKAGSDEILDAVLVAMQRSCEKFPIEIGGHTDADGGDAFNLQLSEARAKAVAQYLLSKGMIAERLSTVGYGEASPIADNATREGKAANRRIEFKVIK